jgi:HlyD family secretion protein
MEKAENNTSAEMNVLLGLGPSTAGPKRWLVAIIVVLLLGAVLGVILMRPPSSHSSETEYVTEESRRGDIVVLVTATGNLKPTNQVDVGCEISGAIRAVKVKANDRVEVNQVLALLDTSKLEAEQQQGRAALASAQAQARQAEVNLRESQRNLDRLRKVRELSQGQVTSEYDLDAAEAAWDRAKAAQAVVRASIAEAQANLDANAIELAKAVIRSPINGVVMSRGIEPGQTMAAVLQSPVLFTLAEDLTQMELHVDVDEADVGRVQAGQAATFTVEAYPERTFQAVITRVSYGASSTSGVVTYETLLKVENTDLALRPGMTATADIIVRRVKDAVLIPNAALRFIPPTRESQSRGPGLVGMLLPHPPHPPAKVLREKTDHHQQQIWLLEAGELKPLMIKAGESDGSMTEVLAGDIPPAARIVIDSKGGAHAG